MAVEELSRINTRMFAELYTALISAGIPEWRKVESPITAATFRTPCLAMPAALLMLAPMHRQVSMAERGGLAPSV